jgi:hypothetical protein
VGRGCGVGRGLGVTLGVAVGVTEAVGVAVGVADGATVAVGVAVAVGVGVGVGPPPAQKISVDASGVTPSEAYPPDRTILVMPSVSVGKFRRAVVNGTPIVQLFVPGS